MTRHRRPSCTAASSLPRTGIAAGRWIALLLAVAGVTVAMCGLLIAPSRAAASVQRGVVDIRLETFLKDPAKVNSVVDPIVTDMGTLRARWTRIVVDWSKLQPVAPVPGGDPGYDMTYVEQLKTITAKLEAAGVNVILSPYLVPQWATNYKELSKLPPPNGDHPYPRGKYYSFYAMDTSQPRLMDAYQEMCRYLAATLAPSGVHHYECGNEPNLNAYMYPQTRPGQPFYGPSTYLKMLKRFHAGIKAADPSAFVIAGANSPRGGNDYLSTSPQRFAGYLKDHGAAQFFDAYSHHPYVTGGQKVSADPGKPPYSTRTVVTMYNISQLLRLFPKKPFFLTEYGYSTGKMPQFGYKVSMAQQASYLRKAYAMAARHRQIKVLLWYLVQDIPAVYTGLKDIDGTPKPGWYAFSGGNSVSLTAPKSAKASKAFDVSGLLTVGEAGGQAGRALQIQFRAPSRTAWKTLKSSATAPDGSYVFTVKQKATRFYRVIWNGVCESKSRKVRTR